MNVVGFVQWLDEWDFSAVLTCNLDMARARVRDLTACAGAPEATLRHYDQEPFDPTQYVFREPSDAFKRAQLLLGLAERLCQIFDWPEPTTVPSVSPKLQLSRSVIIGLLSRLADYAEGRMVPPVTVESGDFERIKSILPESTVDNDIAIRNAKRIAWVGARIRGRYRHELPKHVALGEMFYPRQPSSWEKPALATAGVLAALGVVGGGVALYRSRTKRR